jgi:hypothetical protein
MKYLILLFIITKVYAEDPGLDFTAIKDIIKQDVRFVFLGFQKKL